MLTTKKTALKEKIEFLPSNRLDNNQLAKLLGVNPSTTRKYQHEISEKCHSYIQGNGTTQIFTIEKTDIEIARTICLQNKYDLEIEYSKKQVIEIFGLRVDEKEEVDLLEEIVGKVCGNGYRQLKLARALSFVVNKQVLDKNKEQIRSLLKETLKKLAS